MKLLTLQVYQSLNGRVAMCQLEYQNWNIKLKIHENYFKCRIRFNNYFVKKNVLKCTLNYNNNIHIFDQIN